MHCNIHEFTRRPVKGNTYASRKEAARDIAIEWSMTSSKFNLSYSEYIEISTYFRQIGRRYGLLREFYENGIC